MCLLDNGDHKRTIFSYFFPILFPGTIQDGALLKSDVPAIDLPHLAVIGIKLVVRATNHLVGPNAGRTFDGRIAMLCRLTIG